MKPGWRLHLDDLLSSKAEGSLEVANDLLHENLPEDEATILMARIHRWSRYPNPWNDAARDVMLDVDHVTQLESHRNAHILAMEWHARSDVDMVNLFSVCVAAIDCGRSCTIHVKPFGTVQFESWATADLRPFVTFRSIVWTYNRASSRIFVDHARILQWGLDPLPARRAP